MNEEDFVNDSFLQDALFRLENNYFTKRHLLESKFDFESYKKNVETIKKKNVSSVNANTESLISHLKTKGIQVFFAKSAKDAQNYILEIIKKHNANSIVKSKSLTTEEIHLNQFLKVHSIEAYETDLGEWLVQIAHQPSSHMTAPAIHMSREKIQQLLNQTFGEHLTSDLDELVSFSKNKIKEYFNTTNIGVFGSNVVTKEGLFFIVSNEGNVQRVLERDCNICVVGVDKIVESTQEAFEIINFLPKAATGQLSTSYVDCFENLPGEFFCVLLDNGRMELSKNDKFNSILQCIRCGACQNACPVYTTVSGLAFRGDAYAGPIGVLLSFAFGYEKFEEVANFCVGCMACDYVCSSKIPIQSLILQIKSLKPNNATIKDKILNSLNDYRNVRLGVRLLSFIFKKELKTNIKFVDKYFGFDFRALPKPNKFSFDLLKSTKANIGLFAGCSVNIFYANLGLDALFVSNKLGFSVQVIKQSACCGAACYYNGKHNSALNQAKKNYNDLKPFDYVLFLDPHCAHMMQRDYFELFGLDLSHKVFDFGSFFIEKIKDFQPLQMPITYHHPCHLLRGLKVSKTIENFIKNIEPNFVDLPEANRCCGFAGSYSIMHKSISKSLLERKIENIRKTKAEALVSTCPGCIMQIEGGIKAKGLNIEVMHFVTYLKKILGGKL